ncbi:uncharacterized protein LOC127987327 [Carassius gibelio]|uniref:uncharacterized protein LOC127987327 n=1 Tax=Carassius gibelio TaxID=101364 RepID=UPI002279103A|nr:uncharacterized protein LOC127987327 [Carassius gibelio]
MREMAIKLVLFCLSFWRLDDVFGQEMKIVKPGDSVTLNSGLTEMKDDDEIQWRLENENTLLAKIIKRVECMTIYDDVLDGRFIDRLKLNKKTGSLTITNTRYEHFGLYELERKGLRKSFYLIIVDEISMKEGDSVTLNSDLTEMKDDNVIQWRFGYTENTLLAEINKQTDSMTVYDDVLDGRFRDRLKLNNQTGSLTIRNTTTEDAGIFLLQINNEKKMFLLAVYDEISVKEGDSLTINSGRTEAIFIAWTYMNEFIINYVNFFSESITVYDDVLDGRFRNRLKLDKQTRSLTITNTTTEDAGNYIQFSFGPKLLLRAFRVSVYGE